MTTHSDQTPLTDTELEAIRDRSAALATSIGGETRQQGRLADDVPVLLAEVDRLRAENAVARESREQLADLATQRWEEIVRLRKYEPMALDYIDRHAKACVERDALAAKLDAVHRVITPINPDWKPLDERYPEHFKPVTEVERARRDGWDQGVELLTRRIQAALDGDGQSFRERWESATTPPAPESPRPPAEEVEPDEM